VERTRTESIEATDGGRFDAHVVLPVAGHGAGLLLISEIFGVNDYIRDVAHRLAGLGHVVLTPEVFWRHQPGYEIDSSDPSNVAPAAEVAGAWDPTLGLADLGAAFRHLESLPEVTGATGVIGFCFGGTQAFRLAIEANPSCAVAYYGSGIPAMLDDLHNITCPTLLHFGDQDPYIPAEGLDALRSAIADNHHVELHIHRGGGHAFDNSSAPHFSQPDIAREAWSETASFLFMHLGGPGIGA
jgi:carboxymethylenebutenolidase